MRRLDLLRTAQKSFSVEIEPPTLGRSIQDVFDLLDPLVKRGVGFVDITYHPEQIVGYEQVNGDSHPVYQRKKPGTAGIAGAILGKYANKVQPVPHAICTGFTKYETEEYLIELSYLGVQNVVALRGDPARGPNNEHIPFMQVKGGHAYASELIAQIRNLRKGGYVGAKDGDPVDFCIGAGCYPEKHPEASTFEQDLAHLQKKIDSGTDYLATQMFFDNEAFYRFIELAQKTGIHIPILPGIKPLTSSSHLKTLPGIFGCIIPEYLRGKILQAKDKEEVKKVGLEHCINQCRDLMSNGFSHLHFYAARKAPILEVIEAL